MRKLILLLAISLFSISISAQEVSKIPVTDSVKDTQPQIEKRIENNLASALEAHALDVYSQRVMGGSGTPTNPCPTLKVYTRTSNGDFYTCNNGTWRSITPGSTIPTTVQGDMLYASAANTLSALAKNSSATRYLSNTGTSNNPAWAQIDLSNGVTGNLPVTNLNSGTSASSSTFWRGDGTWGTPSSISGLTTNTIPKAASPTTIGDSGITESNGAVNITSESFGLTGAISGAGIFGTSGIRYKNVASTLTDTTSSGTVATNYTNVFGNNTLAASNATTITNAFNTYISDPVAGSNVTLTNKWALGLDSLKVGTSNQLTVSNAGLVTHGGSTVLTGVTTQSVGQTTSAATDLLINPTTKASGNLIDAQVNSVSMFGVNSAGKVTLGGSTGSIDTSGTSFNQQVAGVSKLNYNFSVSNGWASPAPISITSTTDSTSTSTGALIISGGTAIAKRVFIAGLTTSAGVQTAVLCQSSGGEMIADSVACLASSARFKNRIKSLNSGLNEILSLRPVSFFYKPEGIFANNQNFQRERVGLIAEEVAKIDPRLVGFEKDGITPRTVGYEQIVPVLIKAVQEQQKEIEGLKQQIAEMKKPTLIVRHHRRKR